MSNKAQREDSSAPNETDTDTDACLGAESVTEEAEAPQNVLDIQLDLDTVLGGKSISAVSLRDLRAALYTMLEQRNTLVTMKQTAETELNHARIRMSRMNLDSVRANTEARREVGTLRREILALTRLSNYNASRATILGDALQQTVGALRVYGTQENWNGRTLVCVSEETSPGVFAAGVINNPVCGVVIEDNEARLKDQQVQ